MLEKSLDQSIMISKILFCVFNKSVCFIKQALVSRLYRPRSIEGKLCGIINCIQETYMKRLKIKEILASDFLNEVVLVRGWVRTKRDSKGFSFIELNDGSTLNNIQIVIDEYINDYSKIKAISTGAAVSVIGKVIESPGKGQSIEVQAEEITVYGNADPETYPLQKKRHSFEFLREIAHLRPRTNTFGAVLRVRNSLSFAIHSFFQERGFLYVHTPIITAGDCEGAGELFSVTTLDMKDVPVSEGNVDYSQDFFGEKTGLTVSGQLEGELLALALGDVYTFGPTFRAENSNTKRHLAEFWMVEPEMAFVELEQDLELAEAFMKYICSYCLTHCSEDMEFFNSRIKPGIVSELESLVNSSFEVLTYTDAVTILHKADKNFEYDVSWGSDLQSEHERYITEEYIKKPAFIIDYPKDIKAFYMKMNEDEKTVRAMDLLVPGIGEIIGGSERENDYDKLIMRMKSLDLDPAAYSWYLDSRRYGSVPHAGFGLGFERTVQFITGMQNIRDVIPFPRTPGNASF